MIFSKETKVGTLKARLALMRERGEVERIGIIRKLERQIRMYEN